MKFGCMFIEMKIRLMIFSFFCQYYKTRVSADRFSRAPLFHHFSPKIDANAHFNSVFSNIGWFSRKTNNTVQFFIIKIIISLFFLCIYNQNWLIRGLDGWLLEWFLMAQGPRKDMLLQTGEKDKVKQKKCNEDKVWMGGPIQIRPECLHRSNNKVDKD